MKLKRVLICCIPVLLLVLGYLVGVMYYSDLFLPNTTINGQDVGGKKVMEIEDSLQSQSVNNSLIITRNDGSTEEIKFADIGYTCKYAKDLNELRDSQNKFFWIMSFFKSENYNVDLVTSYDEEKLNSEIESLKCLTNEAIQDPVDARIEKTETGFIVVDAIDGNRLNEDKVKQAIKTGLEKGNYNVDLAEEDCYLKAAIRADDPSITSVMDSLGKYNDLVININLVEATETVDFNTFGSWMNIADGAVTFDEDAIEQYVKGLSAKYNTYGKERTFNATDIGEINVGGTQYDTYGFQLKIYDFENGDPGTMTILKNALNSCESQDIDAIWNIPAKHRGDNDIGDTYIEIDLTRQHMWYYVNGELYVDTPIISGLPTEARETPTGLFRVWHKERDAVLRGQGYASPVDYWMPITWTGVGIHDASWQSSFGGTLYKTRGSHGCINTPYDAVKKIYEKVSYDTPVVVYKS